MFALSIIKTISPMKNSDKINRSAILSFAHSIKNNTKLVWSECQKLAWSIFRLKERLKKNILRITFTKADGTETERLATLNPAFMPERKGGSKKRKKKSHKVTFWSITDGGFRSFLPEKFLKIEDTLSISHLVNTALAA